MFSQMKFLFCMSSHFNRKWREGMLSSMSLMLIIESVVGCRSNILMASRKPRDLPAPWINVAQMCKTEWICLFFLKHST